MQLVGAGAAQLPAPSHAGAPTRCPPEQVALPHATLDVGKLHVGAVPSHVPLHADADPAHEPCPDAGAPVTSLHVPALPGIAHDWQTPVHVVAQQTPSATIPEAH